MRKILMVIVAVALLASVVFFFLDEMNILLKYDVTYRELVKERGVSGTAALFCRYVLAYPIGAILILLNTFKPIKDKA